MDNRRKVFFILSALLFAVLLCRMLFLAGSGGGSYRQSAGKTSHTTGLLSAIRGRIFDRHDKLIAWSERCYDLTVIQLPEDKKRRQHLQNVLFAAMQIKIDWDKFNSDTLPAVIKFNLTAAELASADTLTEKYSEFDVDLRWERRRSAAIPELGEVRQTDGMEHGVSGWEKEFDHILRGKPGTFSVMLDRHGKWVNSTFRIITPPCNGTDVYLSEELPEKNHE